jgi:metal-responsive CopG/Arc/MetJ family transcriptional regulator
MAHIKTAISLQETLLQQLDALAQELDISRSRLFTLAAEEFLQRYQNQKLLETINAAYDDNMPDAEEEELLQRRRRQHRQLVEGQW